MTYAINKNEARMIARQDLTIFREVSAIMEQIISDSQAGLYESTVSDGTTMTESSPEIVITGTVANPTVTASNTIVLNGSTIILGTTGTNLNSVIADINDAGISGISASKNTLNNLVITYDAPAATIWQFEIGASGTANTELGLTAGITTATDPTSVSYWQTWQGSATDRRKQDQMQQVIDYFTSLGYYIERRTNGTTAKTFKWAITY